MNAVMIKLNKKNGVSIILALIFFLICAVIGGIVLTSAYNNAGRLSHTNESQQAYLTVSSAAKMLRDTIDGMEFSYTVTKVEVLENDFLTDTKTTEDFAQAEGDFENIVISWAKKIKEMKTDPETKISLPPQTFTIESDFGKVSGTFSMNGTYKISIVLWLGSDDSEQYKMTLTIPSNIPEPEVETDSVPDTITIDLNDPETNLYETLTYLNSIGMALEYIHLEQLQATESTLNIFCETITTETTHTITWKPGTISREAADIEKTD